MKSENQFFANRFTQLLDEKRKEKINGIRITDSQIATELGVSRKMIYNYKEGESLPKLDVLIRILDYFGVSLEWLIGRSEEKFSGQMEMWDNYGISHIAAVNIRKVNSGQPSLEADRISFDPPIYGSTENGPITFAWTPNLWRYQTLCFGCKTDHDKMVAFCNLEMQTLNMILEDWTLITACTKYIYSVPGYHIAKYNPNYHMFDIIRILNKMQHRVSTETYQKIIESRCAVATIDEAGSKLRDDYDNMRACDSDIGGNYDTTR